MLIRTAPAVPKNTTNMAVSWLMSENCRPSDRRPTTSPTVAIMTPLMVAKSNFMESPLVKHASSHLNICRIDDVRRFDDACDAVEKSLAAGIHGDLIHDSAPGALQVHFDALALVMYYNQAVPIAIR